MLHVSAYCYNQPSSDTGNKYSPPGYNEIGLYDTSPITSDILWYQLIPHC